jgi:hypothetical protein
MIPGLYFVLVEVAYQRLIARVQEALRKDAMRREMEECQAHEREVYGRDAIDVEAREVPDAPLLPP